METCEYCDEELATLEIATSNGDYLICDICLEISEKDLTIREE